MSGEGEELSSSEITSELSKFIVYLCTYFAVSLLRFVKWVVELFRLEKPSKTIESSMAKATSMSPSATPWPVLLQAPPVCAHCHVWLLWGLGWWQGDTGAVSLCQALDAPVSISAASNPTLGWSSFLRWLWEGAVPALLWISAGGGSTTKRM